MMRERLIELIKTAREYCNNTNCGYCGFAGFGCYPDCKDKYIADYLLADGWIRPPCKVGDVLYDIGEFFDGTLCPEMYEYKAEYITMYNKYPDRNEIWYSIDGMDYQYSDFGKTVFLSREEAEAKLKEGAE